MPHAIGWDGCGSCFGCAVCHKAEGDCCGDCTYDQKFTETRVHTCPTCHCDGATFGLSYSNRVCGCEHNCDKEAS
ncbi:hypothetical protein LCGC14_0288820 [marine sediment metagenome]|uniref:Uncharacterized protein n=1 Tax=marine sediment metagenome TaxID=412755 RepID=A0A0F9TTQ8_9ZZZZ